MNDTNIKKDLKFLKADIIVVVSYGLIFPQKILILPRFGCINLHCSLLPRWRGSAPIERALCAGDKKTGITIIQMDSNLDTGNIICTSLCKISEHDTSCSLYSKLAPIGAVALLKTLTNFSINNIKSYPQNEDLATYASKLKKEEARINWYLSALELERNIRAFNPWPVSYFYVENKYVRVLQAYIPFKYKHKCTPGTIIKCSKNGIDVAVGNNEIISLKKIQFASKKPTMVSEILNDNHKWFFPGKILD